MKRKPTDPPAMDAKRRAVSAPACTARYPLASLFASMAHRQPSSCLSCSSQGVMVCAPPRPKPLTLYCVSGDLYTMGHPAPAQPATVKKSPLPLADAYHQHTITHLEWHQNGTTLATADETGKLAVWHLENSVENWTLTYETNLKQPVASFFWLNAERQYVSSVNEDQERVFTREKVHGPRNPFGYLAFVAVTVHGEVSVHFQRNGSIFSSFTTTLPITGHRDTCRSDTGCYGMWLAGLEDWERLSHASMALDQNGDLYLATHYAERLPKIVYLYKISLKFPQKTNDGAIFCEHVADLPFVQAPESALTPITDPETSITHVLLSKNMDGLQLHVCFAHQDTSYMGKWQLQSTTQQIPSHYFEPGGYGDSTLTNRCLDFQYMHGFVLPERLIMSARCTSHGLISVGLSDGSIHMEFRSSHDTGLLRSADDDQASSSIHDSFWQVAEGYQDDDEFADPVLGITFSPSETHLMYLLASGRVGTSRMTMDQKDTAPLVAKVEEQIKLCLLNRRDNLDLISEVIRISHLPEQQNVADRVISNALSAIESFFEQADMNRLLATSKPAVAFDLADELSLAKVRPAYGIAMGVYRRLPAKQIAFTNLTKALQLPVILDCFMASCTSPHTDIAEAIDIENDSNKGIKLAFQPESLWSLVYLSNWILDYTRWVLKEWNILFNSRHPKGSGFQDISKRSTHAVLLVHKASRVALMRILVLIDHFSDFVRQGQYEMTQLAETKAILERQVGSMMASEPVPTADVLAFLRALGGVAGLDDATKTAEIADPSFLSVLIGARMPSGDVLDALKTVTREYRSKCAVPSIYLEKHRDYPVDVIRKRRIALTEKRVRSCIRCYQIYLPESPDTVDPSAYSTWFHSLTRRCLCGGLFF
ncbi:hypothetical protein BC940DRAFT_295407 [Gongronella butleri]|nr:hypothetical protein BC940DRAFT_295407 [Gongronella butleri]